MKADVGMVGTLRALAVCKEEREVSKDTRKEEEPGKHVSWKPGVQGGWSDEAEQ